MIGQLRFHRFRETKRLADAAEVGVHEVKGNVVFVVPGLFEHELVKRVNRRFPIRIVKFVRTKYDALTSFGTGVSHTFFGRVR